MTNIHKRAIEMWVISKINNSETNPSTIILAQLIGEIPEMTNQPSTTLQLCQKINELKGLPDLTENEKVEIQKYGIQLMINSNGSKKTFFSKTLLLIRLNNIGYILGALSLIIGGFTWWILAFGYGTWLAHGAAKMANQKQNHEHSRAWEIPVHFIIHILTLIGLFGAAIFNLLK